ncbi:hypothetical protein Fluta_3188 [Sporocytophaga myxococcoides]|uniref:Uncharacterized protein n=1 Tax=Sporocytophaga myxococcoides TaxID=153721 RepID=A0A098LGE0_9BACT|nr:hypothetical protein [Sporocytophaga myxococcoides]GAL85158.1 hypothetical protein Fluta_3188 [Sporocytophaga myxococcoides]
MIATVKYPIVLISVFLWLGFACALDFIEFSIEYKSISVSTSIEIFLSDLIYNTMTNFEWFFVLLIIGTTYFTSIEEIFPLYTLFIIPFIILSIQTSRLFPGMNNHSVFVIGKTSYSLYSSFCYQILEGIKVMCLLIFGLKLIKLTNNKEGANDR